MANTSAILQQVAPTNYYLPAAQQEPYKKVKPKSFFLNQNIVEFSGQKIKKSGTWAIRRTREKIGKGNQSTALRFQTGAETYIIIVDYLWRPIS